MRAACEIVSVTRLAIMQRSLKECKRHGRQGAMMCRGRKWQLQDMSRLWVSSSCRRCQVVPVTLLMATVSVSAHNLSRSKMNLLRLHHKHHRLLCGLERALRLDARRIPSSVDVLLNVGNSIASGGHLPRLSMQFYAMLRADHKGHSW